MSRKMEIEAAVNVFVKEFKAEEFGIQTFLKKLYSLCKDYSLTAQQTRKVILYAQDLTW